MNKTDKRSERTEALIRSVFFQLLEEMPAYKITVSELCRRADINRGTFYLHYQDCYDLIETLTHEIAEKFSPFIEAICQDRNSLSASLKLMLPILAEDKNISLLIDSSDFCRQIITKHFQHVVLSNWKRLSDISDEQARLIYAYFCGGVFAAIHELGDKQPHTDEYYDSLCRVIIGGLNTFVQ